MGQILSILKPVFISDIEGLVVVLMSRSDAYISRSDDFCGDDDDRRQTRLDCLTPYVVRCSCTPVPPISVHVEGS